MKNKNNIGYWLLGFACIFTLIFWQSSKLAQAAQVRKTEIKIFDRQGNNLKQSFYPYSESFFGGASMAICDLDGNGYEEIIVGAGPGGGPQVRIIDSLGRPKFIPGFFAYPQEFRGGINVACGDLDGDSIPEIVTSPRTNGGPQVRIFNKYGQPKLNPGFFVYDTRYRGGVNIAVADLDGGGIDEIIVSPARNASPEIKIYSGSGHLIKSGYYPFHPDFSGGVSLAAGNLDGGNDDELLVGVQSQDISWIKSLKFDNNDFFIIEQWTALPHNYKDGINLSAGDIDGDGYDEIIASVAGNGGPQIISFEKDGKRTGINFFSYEKSFRGGVSTAIGDINNDNQVEIVVSPLRHLIPKKVDKIIVDLSEQKLYAYKNGFLVKSFLVSTGIPGMDTKTGNFQISQKIYSRLYSGPNYYLPNTLWNMRYDGPRLLHGAYWHNNFGHRMSHGCVNISYQNAEWLYNRVDIGTPVIIKE